MRILVATDAWHPQVNGVVRTLTKLADAARGLDVDLTFLTPQSFRTFAMPPIATCGSRCHARPGSQS